MVVSYLHKGINNINNKNARRVLWWTLGLAKWTAVGRSASAIVGATAAALWATLTAPLSLWIVWGIMAGYGIKDRVSSARQKDFKLLRKVPHVGESVIWTGLDAIWNIWSKLGKIASSTSDSIGHLFNGASNKLESLQISQKLKSREEKTKAKLLAVLSRTPSTTPSSTSSTPSTTPSTPSTKQRTANTLSKSKLPIKKKTNTSAPISYANTSNNTSLNSLLGQYFNIKKDITEDPKTGKFIFEWNGPKNTDIMIKEKNTQIGNIKTDNRWEFIFKFDDFRVHKHLTKKTLTLSYKDNNWIIISEKFKVELPKK